MKTYRHRITETQAKLAEDGKYYIHNCSIGIPKQFIEDSKVWLKEDGYEILSLKSNNLIIYKKDYTFPECFQTLVKAEDIFKIHSIKRLSDGETLTIGGRTKEGIIKRLRFIGDNWQYSCADKDNWQTLETAEKVSEPILITEDGVKLFEEDNYYCVNSQLIMSKWTLYKNLIQENVKIFSSEISAKKYIKDNSKIYSLNDIKETVKKLDCFGTTLIEYLESKT